MTERTISSGQQALALATKRAIQAAGGLDDCAGETGLSAAQLSRCCSPNHRDSLTIRDAVTIQSLTHGHDGHPHILRSMARQLGAIVVVLPDGADDPDALSRHVLELATELGDVSRSVQDALGAASPGGRAVTPAEAAVVLEQLEDHDAASARLRHALAAIVEGRRSEPPG